MSAREAAQLACKCITEITQRQSAQVAALARGRRLWLDRRSGSCRSLANPAIGGHARAALDEEKTVKRGHNRKQGTQAPHTPPLTGPTDTA